MIFVTVGTHEQQFNRLLSEVDRLKQEGLIRTNVVMQSGYSDYVPAACEHYRMMAPKQMEQHMKAADIVITHGGPGSIFGALKEFKIPIVVPRRVDFKEHVDMHQVEFTKHLHLKGQILPVYEIHELENNILQYEDRVRELKSGFQGRENRKAFVQELKSIVNRLLEV
ncbi:glycosyltransferase [Paenibacillus sp. VCA1]|uniref:glycosyltransferase n=1 Tax=Paenibacillus sp. VCA1 TaxID=3039148 RepID=UPI0028726997|nr:glycosyltransferase [Paenibacillus sp. VCA1]MDR9854413.1 glycosyltransferase [Paenibacillus sp. VCA1]